MKSMSQARAVAATLLSSAGACFAACPPGSSVHSVDGKEQCVLDPGVIVIIDPVWLVAGGVALLLLLVFVLYLAVQVRRLARAFEKTSNLR